MRLRSATKKQPATSTTTAKISTPASAGKLKRRLKQDSKCSEKRIKLQDSASDIECQTPDSYTYSRAVKLELSTPTSPPPCENVNALSQSSVLTPRAEQSWAMTPTSSMEELPSTMALATPVSVLYPIRPRQSIYQYTERLYEAHAAMGERPGMMTCAVRGAAGKLLWAGGPLAVVLRDMMMYPSQCEVVQTVIEVQRSHPVFHFHQRYLTQPVAHCLFRLRSVLWAALAIVVLPLAICRVLTVLIAQWSELFRPILGQYPQSSSGAELATWGVVGHSMASTCALLSRVTGFGGTCASISTDLSRMQGELFRVLLVLVGVLFAFSISAAKLAFWGYLNLVNELLYCVLTLPWDTTLHGLWHVWTQALCTSRAGVDLIRPRVSKWCSALNQRFFT